MGIRKTKDTITPDLDRMIEELGELPTKVHKNLRKLTPKRTGNARRKTKMRGQNKVVADYNYAVPLDRGHSKQAPKGMTKPTEEFFIDEVKKIVRKK